MNTYYSFLLVCCCLYFSVFFLGAYAAYTLYRRSNSIYIIMIIIWRPPIQFTKLGRLGRVRKTLTTTTTKNKIHSYKNPYFQLSFKYHKKRREEILFMPGSHVEKSFPFFYILFSAFCVGFFFHTQYYFS